MTRKLEGEEAVEFTRNLFERHRREEAELLAAAKMRAAERGKEPFDLARFEEIYTIGIGTAAPEERLARREYEYYVEFEDTMTMEEFAQRIWDVRDWWDGRR